jgi:hypothetical protein
MEIDILVDQVLDQRGNVGRCNRGKRRGIGISRKRAGMFLGTLAVAGMVIVGLGAADLFNYFVLSGTSVDSSVLFTFDGQSCEDLVVSKCISDAAGGNVYVFDHYLNLSGNADGNRTASFAWDGVPVGINCSVSVDGVDVNMVVVEPGQSVHLVETICLDERLVHGSYSFNLTVS